MIKLVKEQHLHFAAIYLNKRLSTQTYLCKVLYNVGKKLPVKQYVTSGGAHMSDIALQSSEALFNGIFPLSEVNLQHAAIGYKYHG